MTATTENALTPQEQLQARLSDPKILDALNRLLDRAELLAFSADALDGFVRRGDEITNNVGGMVTEARKAGTPPELMEVAGKLPQLARAGLHVADTVDKPEVAALLNSGILEQLGKPETIECLKLILGKIELLAFSVQAVDGFLQRSDVITDNIGQNVDDLRKLASSVDLTKLRQAGEQLPALVDAGNEIISSGVLTKLKQMADASAIVVDSGMLDPQTVKLLAQAGKIAAASYIETQAGPKPSISGPMDLWKALKDPRIKHAMGFFLEFMKRYSEKMK